MTFELPSTTRCRHAGQRTAKQHHNLLARVGTEVVTIAQIADRLGCTEQAARRRLTKARERGVVTWAALGAVTPV